MTAAGFDDKHSHPNWIRGLDETVLALKLEPADVKRVLEAWTAAPRGGATPDRDRIWYSKHRPWVRKAAGLGCGTRKASAPPSSAYDFTEADIIADLRAGAC